MISLHHEVHRYSRKQLKVNFHGVYKSCPSSYFLEWYLILHGVCFSRHHSAFLHPFQLGTPELIEKAKTFIHDVETYPDLRIKYKIPFFIAPHPDSFHHSGPYYHTICQDAGVDMFLQVEKADFYADPEEYFCKASRQLYGVPVEQFGSMDSVHSLIYF